jgi:hypothetical protein
MAEMPRSICFPDDLSHQQLFDFVHIFDSIDVPETLEKEFDSAKKLLEKRIKNHQDNIAFSNLQIEKSEAALDILEGPRW